ncbi:MAG: gamma-glutamyl-gamma-aminobutyrate hydrolase family protein [Candidatus Doudnabacteria bacterium]|nr:gamma-glutamyl-gamma-aminobutyrate hydrolase family protein [Candidatus Doudnabacteria bacterium]
MLQTFKHATAEALAEIAEEKKVRSTNELFLLFSMGSQFDHLIKQKLDALGVFCLVADPASVSADDVRQINPNGIILSGGPASAYEQPPFDGKIFDLGIPVLGICLGFQMWAHHIGVKVSLSAKREFGTHTFTATQKTPAQQTNFKLFAGLPSQFKVMETHGDIISTDNKLEIIGTTDNTPVAAGHYQNLWGVQFHPEVTETEHGTQIYENFCFKICGAKDKFPASEVAKKKVDELRSKIGTKKVMLALSGGSDSSTVAYLLKESCIAPIHRLPPKPGLKHQPINGHATQQILGVYIKGIDRPDDEENVKKYFAAENWLTVKIVDATDKFLTALKGKISMHDKRLAMRGIYKEILETEAKNFGADFIAQGTLYTDISESGGGYDSGAKKAQIKIHHNVNLGFSLPELEPLADCVKDTGRNIGRSLGVPEELLVRQPFPGPGLVVRIEGVVTKEKLHTARLVDGIYIEEMRKWKLYDEIWQAGAVVTNSMITCTKGDDAVQGHVIALWAVWSVNGFTARAAELPYDFLKHVSQRITNEIREVGGVVYRISDKPPVTIEWG